MRRRSEKSDSNKFRTSNQEIGGAQIKTSLGTEIEYSLLLPIQHMENYTTILETLLNYHKETGFFTEDIKNIASIEIKVKKLLKTIMDNYRLNAMNGSVVRSFIF